MKILTYTNGDPMHAVGLGTWKAMGDTVKYAVKEAVMAGMRHIDTAAVYQNETEIGEALSELFSDGVISRDEIFITSKLWNNAHQADEVLPALQESLEKLQLEYLDLYLIHWPVAFRKDVFFPAGASDYIALEDCPISETWRQMEVNKGKGLARHIGVSNFSVRKLEELKMTAIQRPEVNQVELHPLLQQNDLLEYCNSEGIILTAYSPLGSGDRDHSMKNENEPNLMDIPEILDIARKHNISAAQVLICWHLHRDCSVIPKSTSAAHIAANFAAGDIQLDAEDLNIIAGLDKHYRFINGKFFEAPEKGYSNIFDE